MARMLKFVAAAAMTGVGAALTACSTQHVPASMGMVSPQGDVLSLGAGDSLGRAVYVNDLILAAAALRNEATFTTAEEREMRWEFEGKK